VTELFHLDGRTLVFPADDAAWCQAVLGELERVLDAYHQPWRGWAHVLARRVDRDPRVRDEVLAAVRRVRAAWQGELRVDADLAALDDWYVALTNAHHLYVDRATGRLRGPTWTKRGADRQVFVAWLQFARHTVAEAGLAARW